ncbi:type IV toxin-antitoxin system AbiEi family antitoxin domain-containing protein [Actinospongicola halichondriae]|uniref:type IV toxin-antitoxin system AbiEi family antitoxin domain-containing protein n=1 Tax=Actinospongicola halichondriae TaxID=3236844 RepID=UPI003D411764
MSEVLARTAPWLARQHALITAAQLRVLGVHPQQVQRLVKRGIWERIDVGLYGPVGVPMTWRRRLMAATLLGPDGTLVSHRAAAHLDGLGGFYDPRPEVSIPVGTSLRRPDVIVHESHDLHLATPRCIDGIPTTGRLRLAVDLGSVVSFGRFTHTIRELRHGHGVSTEDLIRTYAAHSERGRNGCGALRDWIDRYAGISGLSESGIELLVLDAIIDAQLPTPVRQHWVEAQGSRYRLDLAYPGVRLAIEVDGGQHRDPDVARSDAARTARLEASGWTVVRIRSWELTTDLPKALATIASAVRGSHLV